MLAVWRAGIIARIGLALTIAGTIATAYLVSRPIAVASADPTLPSGVAVAAGLVLLTVAWSLGLAAASALRLPLYLLSSAYLAWFGIVAGGALAGTAGFAIPTLWMLIVGWLMFCRTAESGRWPWFLFLCFGAGYLTSGALGMRRLLPDTPLLVRSALVSVGYAALLCNPFALRLGASAAAQRLLEPSRVFTATCVIVSGFLGMAAVADPEELRANTLLSFENALGLIDFVWMWLGAGLFVASLAFGRWCADRAVEELPGRLSRILIPGMWIVVAVLCYASTRTLPLPFTVAAHHTGLLDWVHDWQVRYLVETAERSLFAAGQWWWIAASLGAGALLGAAFTAGRPTRARDLSLRVATTLAISAAFAWLAPKLPGLS